MKKKIEILPSILSSNFLDLKNNLRYLDGKFKKLHVDIMDGLFVQNMSFGPGVINEINANFDFVVDLHLMVNEPFKYIPLFERSSITSMSIHYETLNDTNLDIIKKRDYDLGLAVNPSTSIPHPDELKLFDYIVIMGVNPGFGAQAFIPNTLTKLKEVQKVIRDNNLDLNVQCDGGIDNRNINDVIKVGVDQIVIGAGIFKGNLIQNIRFFSEIIGSN